ncbi:unnamed protein product [Prunus brigantina]
MDDDIRRYAEHIIVRPGEDFCVHTKGSNEFGFLGIEEEHVWREYSLHSSEHRSGDDGVVCCWAINYQKMGIVPLFYAEGVECIGEEQIDRATDVNKDSSYVKIRNIGSDDHRIGMGEDNVLLLFLGKAVASVGYGHSSTDHIDLPVRWLLREYFDVLVDLSRELLVAWLQNHLVLGHEDLGGAGDGRRMVPRFDPHLPRSRGMPCSSLIAKLRRS